MGEEDPGADQTRQTRRKGGAKVKTGCRTCKIRKVKCDEARPACYRCLSTGRVCDGYGVWGGGGNFYGQRQRSILPRDFHAPSANPVSISIFALDEEEKPYFEWFKGRTSRKLPGVFISNFWNTLLFQACLSEPAVLHAVLTLSSVHKNAILHGYLKPQKQSPPDEHEQFTLQSYIKAISHLKPHFSHKDKSSTRVALVSCIIFVYTELLRGRFRTAQNHLQNGLKVFAEVESPSTVLDGTGILLLEPSRELIDDWIIDAFFRLYLQVTLLRQGPQDPRIILHDSRLKPSILIFHTLNEAWKQLESILNQILLLEGQVHIKQISAQVTPEQQTTLLVQQQKIQAELSQWLKIYEASRKFLQGDALEELAFRVLSAFHSMLKIKIDVCLQLDDESAYDSHTGQFISIINTLAWMWQSRGGQIQAKNLSHRQVDMSRSIVDLGWIPALYYTATKCRVHRVRFHAIRLLECSDHREGFWDTNIALTVARKVMEIEEGDFYEKVDTYDDFELVSNPSPRDLSLPSLPSHHRIRDLKVVLPDGPADKIVLSGRIEQTSGKSKTLIMDYDLLEQVWTGQGINAEAPGEKTTGGLGPS